MAHQEYVIRVYDNGIRCWYQNDELHRLDGPAIEYTDGEKHWLQNGKFHRLNGPAIERADGGKRWYIDGEELAEHEHAERTVKPTCSKTITIDSVEYVLTPKK